MTSLRSQNWCILEGIQWILKTVSKCKAKQIEIKVEFKENPEEREDESDLNSYLDTEKHH